MDAKEVRSRSDTPTDAIKPVALRPCPFCGSEVEGPFPADRKRDYFTIRCGNPACFADIGAPTVEAAAASWNRREPDPEYLREMLRAANADRARLEAEVLRLELAAGAEWERARVAEAALAANVARAADYRDQLLAALERAASAESKFHAVYAYLWKVAPWSESNDMDWADEMICGIDLLLQRAETAEAALAAANARADAWPAYVLNRSKTVEILKQHNEWRRGAEGPQTDPRMLGLALEAAIAAINQTRTDDHVWDHAAKATSI
jgi:hypothetical protein